MIKAAFSGRYIMKWRFTVVGRDFTLWPQNNDMSSAFRKFCDQIPKSDIRGGFLGHPLGSRVVTSWDLHWLWEKTRPQWRNTTTDILVFLVIVHIMQYVYKGGDTKFIFKYNNNGRSPYVTWPLWRGVGFIAYVSLTCALPWYYHNVWNPKWYKLGMQYHHRWNT